MKDIFSGPDGVFYREVPLYNEPHTGYFILHTKQISSTVEGQYSHSTLCICRECCFTPCNLTK